MDQNTLITLVLKASTWQYLIQGGLLTVFGLVAEFMSYNTSKEKDTVTNLVSLLLLLGGAVLFYYGIPRLVNPDYYVYSDLFRMIKG